MVREETNRCGDTTERAKSGPTLAPSQPELAVGWVQDSELMRFEILRGARLRLGRSEECDLRLDHLSVSRLHAELYREGTSYALRDCESTNGSWSNGSRVEHAALRAGDVLRFGECLGILVNVARGARLAFGSLAPDLWGGPTLATALHSAMLAAPSDVPIVLVGETGAGKERIARALHHWSGRSGPFYAINCSTVPAGLAEAELFGHLRGAFTGAERARTGHFQAAHGGTLFLDEIADLPLDLQAKFLRAVDMGEVIPLGSSATGRVDVRIVVAAQEPLQLLVEQKRFRSDLAARLAGFVVHVPSLRSRREDLPSLFSHFLRKHCSGPTPRVSPELLEWLCLRDWPGNVRELELLARKLLALHATEPVLELCFAHALDPSNPPRGAQTDSSVPSGFRDRRESERHRLKCALEQTNGNLTAAARSVGISRRRAYRLLEPPKRD